VIDAARRDHFTVYGYPRPTTPFLASIASSARVYERALAGSTQTRSSVPVMLSARRVNTIENIQRHLAQAGYTSACFSDNPVLEDGSAVVEHFDHVAGGMSQLLQFPQRVFEGSFVGTFVLRWPLLAHLWDDARLTDRAIAWGSRQPGPVFLYLHLMDAHMPYDSEAIDGRRWRGRQLQSPQASMRISQAEAEDVVAHYDGGLRNGDRQVGRLLAAATSWGRPWLAVITADHGESLGEGGRWGHAGDLAPERLTVPLIVAGTDTVPGRVFETVGHTSIARTILAAAAVPCPDCAGSDLRSSDGDAVVEGFLPPDLYYRVAGGYKLVWDAARRRASLYHLPEDPHELDDLASRQPEIVSQIYGHGLGDYESSRPTPEDLERFRALGYLGN
jgi:arylsulfatase A-like enzyme